MEALVKTQAGDGFLEIREMEKPVVGDDEVLIRVRAAGICGSDLHIAGGKYPCNAPVVLGHEFSGEISEVGKNVKNLKIGDRVVAEPHKGGCGYCRHCLTGNVEVCSEKRAIGYKIDGCFLPYLTLPGTSIHKIPDNLSFEHAALTEPLAVVVKAVLERSTVEPEDFVVVLGCGPIGLLAAAAAKAEGARAVMITGMEQDVDLRLSAALEMGIDYAVNVQKEDVLAKVKELTNGKGADLVVEASGAPPAIKQAFEIVRIDGRMSAIGITGAGDVPVPWGVALHKAARMMWSFSSNWTSWERALSILSNRKINVEPLITHTFPLREFEKAFDLLKNLQAIKILLMP